MKRVLVLGTTGSGKTTLAQTLSDRMGMHHLELDAYRHGPNWTETPNDEFRRNIRDALVSIDGNGWVVDGNYSVARDILWSNATTIIWLDLPFSVVFPRLILRTFGRAIRRTELWNGNRERLWEHFLTTDSLLLWAVKTHWSRRKRLETTFARGEYPHLKVIRFRRPSQLSGWLESADWPANVDSRCLVQ